MGSADVLRRAGILAGHTDGWPPLAGRRCRRGFDDDPMLPAIPHVVAVLEFAMRSEFRHHGGDRDPPLVAIAADILVHAGLLYPPVRRHQTRTHLEFVSVGVRPTHHPLQITVRSEERRVGKEGKYPGWRGRW